MNFVPLITVGITCFNAEATIARAVRSALAQDWPNKEILIVDDCSSDGSVAVLEALARENGAVRVIRHAENRGPGAARQTIVQEAKGEFIAFFDDDDESLPARLSCQYERLTSYRESELVACYASGRRVYPNGYIKTLTAIGVKPVVPSGPEMAAYILFFDRKPGRSYGGTPSCALMARRSTFLAVGGFDPGFRRVEDLDFAVRLALAGGHFIGCAEELFIQHATEASDKTPQRNLEAERKLAEKHKSWLESIGMYRYARDWPTVRYYHFTRRPFRMVVALAALSLRHPFRTVRHILESGPKRFFHERKIKKEKAGAA